MKSFFNHSCFWLAALFLIAPACHGQSAQITGRVADSSGGVVVGAPVVVRNADSGVSYSAESNSTGYFTVSRLEPGNYELAVHQPGFRSTLRKGIVLQVDQTVRLDVTLEVGDVTQAVEITAAAPLIESETSNVGQVVGNKSIVEMPLNGRNAWDLSMLSGGTVYVDATGDGGEIPVVAMAGSRTMSQALMLDGGSVQKSGLARAQAELSPMVDAVEEFKVITNNYAAEYGRTAGGVFTAVTKSGTNQFRGSLFEFFRNDAMDARNFFSIDKAPLRYNQFGGTLGGPIRKNKTHFFAALETTKSVRGQTLSLTVPTAEQKAGNFVNLVNAQGQRLPIYDPFSSRPDPADATRQIRDPFAGNIVPAAMFDPVAVKALTYYPAPNLRGNTAGANNFITNVAPRRTQQHGTLRVDHTLSAKDRIYGRYVAQANSFPQASAFSEPAASGQGPAPRSVDNLAHTFLLSWVRTVNASLLNDMKFSWINQDRSITHASTDAGWPEKLGLTGLGGASFPIFRPAGYTFLGAPNPFRAQTNPGWQILEAVSYYRGKHSVKAGFEYRSNRTTDDFDRMPGGDFTFSQQGTGLQSNTRSGNGLATMLLGFVSNGSLNSSPLLAFSTYYTGGYLQDDWKILPSLTLNFGIRYDIEPGRVADNNTQSGFDMNRIHPLTGNPGVVTFVGIDEPARLFNTDRNNLAPRFGFAWTPRGRTVVRGGFGVFYGNPDDQGYNNTSVLGFATQVRLVSADQNQSAAFLLRNGIRNVEPAGTESRTPAFGVGSPVDFYQRERASPYSLQYNFGIQHELRGSVLISAQYLGNLGRKLTANALDINQVTPDKVGLTGSIQSRRPYPQFTAVELNSPNLGHSSYHGALLRVEKRYRNGMQFLANYTFAKFIDNVDSLVDFGGLPGSGYQDYYNRRLDKSISGNDIKHNVSFNAIYELPAGKGRKWMSSGGALSRVLGGWQISVLGTLRSGPPYGVTTQQNTTEASSSGPQRPDLLRAPDLPASERSVERWFDTEAFAQPARFKFGTAARAVGRAPGLMNFNTALMKNFAFAERFRLQFRGELFNALNHASFRVPGTTYGSPTFGVINSARDARVAQLGLKLYF